MSADTKTLVSATTFTGGATPRSAALRRARPGCRADAREQRRIAEAIRIGRPHAEIQKTFTN